MKTIGIVGGGASGTLVALHCWKKLQKNIRILIFDPAEKIGRGNAYAQKYDDYILNVPANNMGIFPEHPDEFEKWVMQFYPHLTQSRDWPFVPRYYFGLYLDDHLSQISKENFQHICKTVTKIDMIGRKYRIKTNADSSFLCDYLILATGYGTEPVQFYQNGIEKFQDKIFTSENYHRYDPSKFSGRVLIIGSGLTAIDVWRKLNTNNETKITFFSRRGFFPLEQNLSHSKHRFPTLYGMTPLQILQVVRALHTNNNVSWVTIANHIRPQAQKIWTCWTEKEKAQFLKYLKPYWEVIRHRMPSSVFSDLQRNLSNKKTEIRSGKIIRLEETQDQFKIHYRERISGEIKAFHVDHIIYATGLPINQNLLCAKNSFLGLSKCPYGMGYLNKSAPRIWVVGPASKGMFWENVAIPDIRIQAENIANNIANIDNIQHLRREIFFVHPHSAKEGYWLHFKKSASFSIFLCQSMWYAFVHACFPFLYTDKISSRVRDLSCLLTRRRKKCQHRSTV